MNTQDAQELKAMREMLEEKIGKPPEGYTHLDALKMMAAEWETMRRRLTDDYVDCSVWEVLGLGADTRRLGGAARASGTA